MRATRRAAVVLVALGAVVATSPRIAATQPPASLRLGVLLLGAPETDANFAAFRQALLELGYADGRNLAIEYRYAGGDPGRLPSLAAELVQRQPDVIFALGGDVAPFAKRATGTIPIVFVTSADPVQANLVPSLARPRGNVTGLTLVSSELAGKRLQLLKEAAPRLSRVGVLWNPEHPDGEIEETQAAAQKLGVQVLSLEVKRPADFDAAFQAALAGRVEAIIVVSSRLMTLNRLRILEFAAKNRLPLVGGWGPWAQGGALLSYGPDLNQAARRAATYVDKILKGAKPADLPVEQPTKFVLVVNLKTARAFGLSIPPSILLRADQVIE